MFITIFSSLGLALFLYGWSNRCPNCKRLFAKQFFIRLIGRDLLKEDSWELLLWKRNLLTDFKVVPFKRIYFARVYLNRYRCSKCGYEFSFKSRELSFKDIEIEVD